MPHELTAEELSKARHEKLKKVAIFSGTGVEKGRENDAKVAEWTYRWGFVTEQVLKRLLNVTYPVTARYSVSSKTDKKTGEIKYSGKGLLEKVTTPPGFCSPYVLTEHGLNIARKNWTGNNLSYPWPKSRLKRQELNHDEMSQCVALASIGNGTLQAEREYKDGKKGAVPDFIITRQDKTVEWHETEINGKDGNRLIFQIQERIEALKRGEFTRLIWHFDKEADRKTVIKEMGKDCLPYIARDNYHYTQDVNQEGLSPAALDVVSEYRLIDKELNDFDSELEISRKIKNDMALHKFEAMHL
mgnify:CR=1 FL=1